MTNQKMPSLAEIHDRLYELEPLNLPSAKDLAHVSYEDSKAETLGYEKQYKALLDQVRDKTTEEKIAFIKERVPEIRNMVSIASLTHEMNYTAESDDALAFILVYRYEHDISIMDDLHLEITREPVKSSLSVLAKARMRKKFQAELEFERTHPEEYERQRKMKLEIEKQKNRECLESAKKMMKNLTPEDVLRILGSKK